VPTGVKSDQTFGWWLPKKHYYEYYYPPKRNSQIDSNVIPGEG